MNPQNRITTGRILTLALALATAATLYAQTQRPTDHFDDATGQVSDEPVTAATDLTHPVAFQLGDTHLLPGDDIHIDSVLGSSDTITPGNVYLVTGTYKLASHPGATLSTNVTTTTNIGSTQNHDPATQPRNTPVQQGEGHFKVYLHMPWTGYPHLSFYPTQGGSSFASVYFGTGTTVMKSRTSTSPGL